jgi:hypothetical protein
MWGRYPPFSPLSPLLFSFFSLLSHFLSLTHVRGPHGREGGSRRGAAATGTRHRALAATGERREAHYRAGEGGFGSLGARDAVLPREDAHGRLRPARVNAGRGETKGARGCGYGRDLTAARRGRVRGRGGAGDGAAARAARARPNGHGGLGIFFELWVALLGTNRGREWG